MDHAAPCAPAAGALAGLRVLDFSIMLAGPYGARLLADLGADVIKIEPPEGDDMRLRQPLRERPPAAAAARGASSDGSSAVGGAAPHADAGEWHSAYFGQLNAGKRSIALDLKRPEAIGVVRRLAVQADVVLENFRPGVMDRLSLGADALCALNPRLIYCSISGYGQSGPAAGRAAYAMIVQAASGYERTLMRHAGDRQRPAATATFVADLLGGLYAFGAIQSALLQRTRTGLGQKIDVALMDCMLNLLVHELQQAQFPVRSPRATYGPVAAADGDLLIAPITARNFDALCEVTQLAALRDDARFATLASRSAHWAEMMQVVETWTRPRPLAECLRRLEAGGVPCARYADPADAFDDEHLRQRGVFSPVSDAAGAFIGVNPPWQMSATASHIGGCVPTVGQHTDAVLRELLATSDDELARLRAVGAIAGGSAPSTDAP